MTAGTGDSLNGSMNGTRFVTAHAKQSTTTGTAPAVPNSSPIGVRFLLSLLRRRNADDAKHKATQFFDGRPALELLRLLTKRATLHAHLAIHTQ